jgi:hypothetical protein
MAKAAERTANAAAPRSAFSAGFEDGQNGYYSGYRSQPEPVYYAEHAPVYVQRRQVATEVEEPTVPDGKVMKMFCAIMAIIGAIPTIMWYDIIFDKVRWEGVSPLNYPTEMWIALGFEFVFIGAIIRLIEKW